MRSLAITCFVTALPVSVASGSLIEFTFTGVVEEVLGTPSAPFGGAAVGDRLEFRYRFESTTPDSNPDPEFGRYSAIVDGVLSVGSASAAVPIQEFSHIRVIPNSQGAQDRYAVSAGRQSPLFVVNLSADFELGALGSDALPTDLPFDRWLPTAPQFHDFSIGFPDPAQNIISGRVDGFIPEPGTLGLLGVGAILVLRRR